MNCEHPEDVRRAFGMTGNRWCSICGAVSQNVPLGTELTPEHWAVPQVALSDSIVVEIVREELEAKITALEDTVRAFKTKAEEESTRANRLSLKVTNLVERQPLTHVAMRFRGNIWALPKPYRHHHIIRLIIWLSDTFGDQSISSVDTRDEDQGFLDASGRYFNRKQALVNAEMHKQIKNGRIIGGVLTSEDLW